jgi:ribonuclease P protein component
MTKQLTLGKDERLKSRKRIDQVFKDGGKFTVSPFRVHFILDDNGSGLQAGFGVSAKTFKKAVDRNRIKRLTREAWRLEKDPLKYQLTGNRSLAVFIVFTANEIQPYSTISEKIKKIITKLASLIIEKK